VVGERLRPIQGPRCGAADPVRLRAVSGVAVSPPAVVDCATALALDDWVSGSALPAWGRLGRGLGSVSVGTSFSCTAADAAGHATGQAVDITGFTLRNGIEVPVAKGWRDPVAGQVLTRARDGACKIFPAVLSPDAGRAQAGLIHLSTLAQGRRSCR